MRGKVRLIQCLEEAALVGARGSGDIRQRFEIEHRRALAANLRALIDRRQPPRSPIIDAIYRQSARVAQHDVSRQILSLGAQRINDPRTPGRPASLKLSTMDDAQG